MEVRIPESREGPGGLGGGFTILVGDQRSAALLHIGQSTELVIPF